MTTDGSVISVDDAIQLILVRLKPLPQQEIAIVNAVGSVLAEDIRSEGDVPAFTHSSVDGYAIRSNDVKLLPVRLKVVGSVAAGAVPERGIARGEAMRIMTGAAVPDGADAVVPSEHTDGGTDVVTVTVPVHRGHSIRRAGEEARCGDVLVPRGIVVTPACVGLLASMGRVTTRTYARPRVAVIATGSELVDIRDVPRVGQARAANAYSLAAAVRGIGGQPLPARIVLDDLNTIGEALEAARTADAVLISGGTARGDYDFVRAAMARVGTVHIWSVASRPGRIVFGEMQVRGSAVPVFALPGNPVGALLTFEVFARPALLRLAGVSPAARARIKARTTNTFGKPEAIRLFTAGIYDAARGTVTIRDRGTRHMLTSLAVANCLVDIPESVTEIRTGDIVDIVRLDVPDVFGGPADPPVA